MHIYWKMTTVYQSSAESGEILYIARVLCLNSGSDNVNSVRSYISFLLQK